MNPAIAQRETTVKSCISPFNVAALIFGGAGITKFGWLTCWALANSTMYDWLPNAAVSIGGLALSAALFGGALADTVRRTRETAATNASPELRCP